MHCVFVFENLKPFSVAQSSILFKHRWSLNSMVSIFFDLINIPKSTKREQSMSFTHLTMSLTLIPNKVGDKMLPCGTPCSCLNMSDNVLPIRTFIV